MGKRASFCSFNPGTGDNTCEGGWAQAITRARGWAQVTTRVRGTGTDDNTREGNGCMRQHV